MGFLQKIKDIAGIEDIEDDDEIEEETSMTKYEPRSERTAPAARPAMQRPEAAAPQAARPAATASRFTQTAQLKMVVIEPQSFDESPRLVDSLKAKKPVIINLENLETDVARKIFDFLSGATYALNGNVQKIANNIFVFAPENVDVTYNNGARASEQPVVKSPWNR